MLGWVLKGAYTNAYSRAKLDVRSSILIFCPAGELHTTSSRGGAHCFSVELEPTWSDRLEKALLPEVPSTFERASVESVAMKLYQEFYEADRASSLAVEGLVLELVALAMRLNLGSTPKPPYWLIQVRELLHDRYREQLTITDMAEEVLIHPVYLASKFRGHYGCSIGEYVRQLRVHYASTRLARSEESIASIAHDAGFSDQSHFSRTFKKITGLTPARYRSLSGRA